jgi:hypothetical protein
LKGEDKRRYFESLAKVMQFRNAFAHGELQTDLQKVWLTFFQGSPKKEELSDVYLTQIESTMRFVEEKTFTIGAETGAIQTIAV